MYTYICLQNTCIAHLLHMVVYTLSERGAVENHSTMYVCAYMCVHLYQEYFFTTFTYICVYMYICIYVYMYICTCIYVYVCIYLHIVGAQGSGELQCYVCVCVYEYMYMKYMYINRMYICTFSKRRAAENHNVKYVCVRTCVHAYAIYLHIVYVCMSAHTFSERRAAENHSASPRAHRRSAVGICLFARRCSILGSCTRACPSQRAYFCSRRTHALDLLSCFFCRRLALCVCLCRQNCACLVGLLDDDRLSVSYTPSCPGKNSLLSKAPSRPDLLLRINIDLSFAHIFQPPPVLPMPPAPAPFGGGGGGGLPQPLFCAPPSPTLTASSAAGEGGLQPHAAHARAQMGGAGTLARDMQYMRLRLRPLHRLVGHDEAVTCVAVVPLGSAPCVYALDHTHEVGALGGMGVRGLLASSSLDGSVRLWSLATGEPLEPVLRPLGRACSVECVALAPDGKCVAAGCDDGAVRVWNLAGVNPTHRTAHAKKHASRHLSTRNARETLVLRARGALDVVADALQNLGHDSLDHLKRLGLASAQGTRAGGGCSSGCAGGWAVVEARRTLVVDGHRLPVSCLVYSRSGALIVSACVGGEVKVWLAADGILLRTVLRCPLGVRVSTLQLTSEPADRVWVGCSDGLLRGARLPDLEAEVLFTCHTCNTLQHTATHCNTLQHTVTHCNTLHHCAPLCNTLQHSATWRGARLSDSAAQVALICNTLRHTATYCNTLRHTAIFGEVLACPTQPL